MQNKMFRTSLQQDSQEFLRCLLTQIHEEIAVEVPAWAGVAGRSHDQSRDTPGSSSRNSMVSSTSHDSELFGASGDRNSPLRHLISDVKGGSAKTSPMPKKKVFSRLSLKQKPTGSSQSLTQSSPTNHRRFALRSSSSSKGRNNSKGSDENISRGPLQQPLNGGSQASLESEDDVASVSRGVVHGDKGDVYEVDKVTRHITLHRNCHVFDCSQPVRDCKEGEGRGEERREEEGGDTKQKERDVSRSSQRKVEDRSSTAKSESDDEGQ